MKRLVLIVALVIISCVAFGLESRDLDSRTQTRLASLFKAQADDGQVTVFSKEAIDVSGSSYYFIELIPDGEFCPSWFVVFQIPMEDEFIDTKDMKAASIMVSVEALEEFPFKGIPSHKVALFNTFKTANKRWYIKEVNKK